MFTEAIKCDPKDNRYIISGPQLLNRKDFNSRHGTYLRCYPSAFLIWHPAGSLVIDPIAITAWSSTLRPWQTLNAPFSWPQTGPKDTSARAVLSWEWRWVQVTVVSGHSMYSKKRLGKSFTLKRLWRNEPVLSQFVFFFVAVQWGREGYGAGAETGQRLWRGCHWPL